MLTPDQARAAYASVVHPKPRAVESVRLISALGRVLAADVAASTDLPPFNRSAVDGWAVRAADLTDAAPDRPVPLRRLGEVYMGAPARVEVVSRGTVRIPTGGEIPAGADAVLMQEYADAGGEAIRARRAVRAGENVVERGIDVRAGQVILSRGRRLRAADLGILAGMGMAEVGVFLPPRVAIMATGDEVVPPDAPLRPGQVRDMNSPALAGAVLEAGGSPTLLGIVPDERQAVDAALGRALAAHDMVLVSGGSSVGERDVVADAIGAMGPPGIVVHGIAVRPGKPTVLAAAGEIPVIGLPGNPVSALVIFDIFARPVLEALAGMDAASRAWDRVRARVETALPAAGAREDHRRVRLEARSDGLWAVPLPGGSQILTSLVQADGIVVVPPSGAGFVRGEEVEVRLL